MKITTCLVGSFSSGKSTLLKRYILKEEFKNCKISPTIGMCGIEKHTVVDNIQIKNVIFDTAGQERYSSLIPIYLRNCDILLFTIDPTNYKESLNYFKCVIPDIIDLNKYIIICFTKSDSITLIENGTVKDIDDILSVYKKSYKIIYTSSFTNKNVELAFTFYLKQAHDNNNIIKKFDITHEEPKNCCVLS